MFQSLKLWKCNITLKVFRWITQNTTRWRYQIIEAYLCVWLFTFCVVVSLFHCVFVLLCAVWHCLSFFLSAHAHFYSFIPSLYFIITWVDFKVWNSGKSWWADLPLTRSQTFSLYIFSSYIESHQFSCLLSQWFLKFSFLSFYVLFFYLYNCLFMVYREKDD